MNSDWYLPLSELNDSELSLLVQHGVKTLTKWTKSLIYTRGEYAFNPYPKFDELQRVSREIAIERISTDLKLRSSKLEHAANNKTVI